MEVKGIKQLRRRNDVRRKVLGLLHYDSIGWCLRWSFSPICVFGLITLVVYLSYLIIHFFFNVNLSYLLFLMRYNQTVIDFHIYCNTTRVLKTWK
jgi:hypothetical protein